MQIYSPLHPYFFSGSRHTIHQKGFTLVELLVSVAIIGVVSSIVLFKYNSFDSTVLLKGAAYEIALSIREAQVKSVSGARTGTSFDRPYGVTFTPNQKTYTAFRFEDSIAYPNYAGTVTNLNTFTLGGTMQVSDICIIVGTIETCETGITRLDVSFRRPEFKALFYAEGYGGTQANIESAKIKVSAGNSAFSGFVILITQFGQISVYKE